jgi:hypothetical protein
MVYRVNSIYFTLLKLVPSIYILILSFHLSLHLQNVFQQVPPIIVFQVACFLRLPSAQTLHTQFFCHFYSARRGAYKSPSSTSCHLPSFQLVHLLVSTIFSSKSVVFVCAELHILLSVQDQITQS